MNRFQRTVLLLSFASLAVEHATAQESRQPTRAPGHVAPAPPPEQRRVRTRYLELVNQGDAGIAAVALAQSGSDDFQDKPFKGPLRQGGDARLFGHTGRGCDYAVRVTFDNGVSRVYDDVDLCRQGRLTITAPPANPTRLTMR